MQQSAGARAVCSLQAIHDCSHTALDICGLDLSVLMTTDSSQHCLEGILDEQ